VQRFFTPLLRRVYTFFAAFLACYFTLAWVQQSAWNKERLYARLLQGQRTERARAAAQLATLGAEEQLLRALRTGPAPARRLAESALWELWFHAAGPKAFRLALQAVNAAEQGDFASAIDQLDELIQLHPGFAEAWNQRALVHWHMGDYEASLADCRRVVELKPQHFGAWQGMAVCQLRTGDVRGAVSSLRRALEIKPHDRGLRRFLECCEDLLAPARRRATRGVVQA
jgi:Flp pilus assembly protein TadD